MRLEVRRKEVVKQVVFVGIKKIKTKKEKKE